MERTSCIRSYLSTMMLIHDNFPKFTPAAINVHSPQDEFDDVFLALCSNIYRDLKILVFSDRPVVWEAKVAHTISSKLILVKDDFIDGIGKPQILIKNINNCYLDGFTKLPTITVMDSQRYDPSNMPVLYGCNSALFTIYMNNTPQHIAKTFHDTPALFKRRLYHSVMRDARVTTNIPRVSMNYVEMLITHKAVPVSEMPPLQITCHVVDENARESMLKMSYELPSISHFMSFDKDGELFWLKKDYNGSVAVVVSHQFILRQLHPMNIIVGGFFKIYPELVQGKNHVAVNLLQIFTLPDDDNTMLISEVTRKIRANWVVQTSINEFRQ
uniref:ORF26 n=1 Tax=Malaco herpesvirus 1 TaxID=3031797 RepID=A0AA48P7X2_9VIRU|nr:TPA_asm: ORF26 [Malaco herpesvirus 1]